MKQDLDWKRFKTSERIFAGNKREIPEAYKQFLRFIWKERTEELIAFLKDEFNIHDIPGEWNVTLAAQDAEAVVVEKDFKGFGIVQYRDKLYGISAETLNNNSEIPLIDKICSSAAEGENIYQVKKHIARLERAYIWSEFDHDPVLMRIADDIELLADNRYCDIFEKVINDDYLLHILDSHNLMREIFLESDYKGFNIIHFRNKLYALSRDLGAVRLADVDYSEIETWQKNKMCFIGETFRDIESLINGSDIDDWLDTIIDQLNRLVQHEEALFGNGEAGKAYSNLSVILQRINQIRGTIINDMAVIHTQEWELDEAERLLVSLMQEGSDCENAARNLEIVRNIKRGFYPQADNVTEQSPLITEAKGVTE